MHDQLSYALVNIFSTNPVMEPSTYQPRPTSAQLVQQISSSHFPDTPKQPKHTLAKWLPRDFSIFLFLFLIGALFVMAWLYLSARHLVILTANEKQTILWTRQTTVRHALNEAGLKWNPEDIIQPTLDAPLPADGRVTIRGAMPITIKADGMVMERRTQSTTIANILRENNLALKPSDLIYLDGRAVDVNASLPRYSATAGRVAMPAPSLQPTHIMIERAVPIAINDNGLVSTIFTTERTLGAALRDYGAMVYLGDDVSPDLGNPVTAGAAIFIRRSRAASISVDGRMIKTRTRAATVADLLTQEGVQLTGKDYTTPVLTTPIRDGQNINVARVREVFVTETTTIPYQVRWQPAPDVEIDTQIVVQEGTRGVKQRLSKLVYENGNLVSRGLEREWIEKPPQDRVVNYGTKIIVRSITLPDGRTVQYWRKIRMLATSYSAATSGKSSNHPQYGITYLGLKAGKGVVAVDPRVINLRATVYVPGYGTGLAGDIGGGIKGRRIDLGYNDNEIGTASWYRWVDVYLLTPAPPTKQISYTLPDSPQESTRGSGR